MRYVPKKMMGVKFGRCGHSKAAFWSPKSLTFFISSQICMLDWNWSGAHFLHEWLFLYICTILCFWDMIDFVYWKFRLYSVWFEINRRSVNTITFELNFHSLNMFCFTFTQLDSEKISVFVNKNKINHHQNTRWNISLHYDYND